MQEQIENFTALKLVLQANPGLVHDKFFQIKILSSHLDTTSNKLIHGIEPNSSIKDMAELLTFFDHNVKLQVDGYYKISHCISGFEKQIEPETIHYMLERVFKLNLIDKRFHFLIYGLFYILHQKEQFFPVLFAFKEKLFILFSVWQHSSDPDIAFGVRYLFTQYAIWSKELVHILDPSWGHFFPFIGQLLFSHDKSYEFTAWKMISKYAESKDTQILLFPLLEYICKYFFMTEDKKATGPASVLKMMAKINPDIVYLTMNLCAPFANPKSTVFSLIHQKVSSRTRIMEEILNIYCQKDEEINLLTNFVNQLGN